MRYQIKPQCRYSAAPSFPKAVRFPFISYLKNMEEQFWAF